MREGRKVWVKVRASQTERVEWHAKAAGTGLSLSDLVRRSMRRVRTWTAAHAARERTRELARIGSNLNQIARWANTYKENAAAVGGGASAGGDCGHAPSWGGGFLRAWAEDWRWSLMREPPASSARVPSVGHPMRPTAARRAGGRKSRYAGVRELDLPAVPPTRPPM